MTTGPIFLECPDQTAMNKKPYQLGVLGIGEGRSILSATDRSEAWETACICDLNEDLCRQRLREHTVDRYTTHYEEMLADPKIDAVAIYTPDPLHADHCLQALRAGKHVICTKPLVDDLASGRELLDTIRKSGKRLMVGMSCRFFETFREQRRQFEETGIGELLSVESHYHGDKRQGTSGAWGKQHGNNWIYTGLVHPVDLVTWYAGAIEEVFGYAQVSPAARDRGLSLPDNFHFVLKSHAGTPVTVSGCFGAPANHPEAESMIGCLLRGSTGCLDAKYPAFENYSNLEGTGPIKQTSVHRHPYYFRWGGSMHHAGEFQNYLEYFASCLENHERPRPGPEDGLRVVAILSAMETSLKQGRPVRIDEILSGNGLTDLIP